MVSIEISDVADSQWNKRLIDSSLGSIHQTNEFAIYTQKVQKRKPLFLKFLNDNGKIIGQLLFFEYSRFEKKGVSGKILKNFSGFKANIYRWKFGPIIFEKNYEGEICSLLYEFLISKKSRVIGTESQLLGGSLEMLKKPFKIQEWATFLIDLSEDEDILWKKMDKHSAQNNIKRSEKRGVSIKEISENDLPIFHSMVQQTKGLNYKVTISEVQTMWQNLHKIGLTGFLAYENEIPVGGIIVSSFNGYINEFGIARTTRDFVEKLYSQDLLKWHVIKWGKNRNLRYYDLTGVNPYPKDEKEKGIFRYKKKWGGNLITYNRVTL